MAEIRLLELRSTYKWGGGPDKTILLSAERHDPARVSVVVAYLRDVADQEFRIGTKAKAHGFQFYEVSDRGKFDIGAVRIIRDIILRHDINLIHSHDYKSDLLAFLVRRWMRKRSMALVSTAHAWVILGLRGELYRRLDLMLMKRFNHLIAVSQATKDEMVAAGVPGAQISVIHNGIDTETWAQTHVIGDFRRELGVDQAFPIIGYVGRIMPEKDLQTWLRAAACVAKQYPHARFILVGDGSDGSTQRELQRLAEELGIADMTFFPGYREKLLPIYASFDIFMMSSRREGLPNSILEAMAMRLPVVTTDVAGAKELVADNVTGFVRPQGDVEGLAQSLLTCINNRDLRLRMGSAGRERVEAEFSFAQRLQKVEDLYAAVVRNPLSSGCQLSDYSHASNNI
jgi:glycosyltransferase involved in cell wall biosynthesis